MNSKHLTCLTNFISKNFEIIALVTITLLLFTIKAIWVIASASGPTAFGDEQVYRLNAEAIYSLSKYQNFSGPPLYPFFLSFSFFFDNWYIVMLIINTFLTTLIVPASWFLAKSLHLQNPLIVALLVSILPIHVIYPFYILSENLFVPLFIFTITLAIRGGKRGNLETICFGFVLALSYLTKFLFLPSIPLLLIIWSISYHNNIRELKMSKILFHTSLATLLVVVTFVLVMTSWIFYGIISGFEVKKLLGFTMSGLNADEANLNSLIVWTSAYSAYVILAWLPVWTALVFFGFSLVKLVWRKKIDTSIILFLTLTFLLTGGYWLLATLHSFGAPYNYPEPSYLLGRYLMHLAPLFYILMVWVFEQLNEHPENMNPYRGIFLIISVPLIALLAQGILFQQIIWPFPNWFANIIFNAPDITAIADRFILWLVILASLFPLFILRLKKRSFIWIILPIFIFMIFSIKLTIQRRETAKLGIHAREVAKTYFSMPEKNQTNINIILDYPALPHHMFVSGLEFFGVPREQIFVYQSIIEFNKNDKTWNDNVLFITEKTKPFKFLHNYEGNKKSIFNIYQLQKSDVGLFKPKIIEFGPKKVYEGTAFNIQPNGLSAMWFVTKNVSKQSYLLVNNQRINLAFGKDGTLSAIIPQDLFSNSGEMKLYIYDPLSGLYSDTLIVRVLSL